MPNVAPLVGINFSYYTDTRSDRYFLPEIMGGGVAWLDYDGDGWSDLFLVNGCVLPDDGQDTEHVAHFYRNSPSGTFTEVAAPAGIANRGYGQGVCVGDYNNDGFPDVYVTHYGSNTLYSNNGDGTFNDVTLWAGANSAGWSTSCAFGDLDRDGNLELYVAHYVATTMATHPTCTTRGPDGGSVRAYCGPDQFLGEPDVLFGNKGDGTFIDITEAAGCTVPDPQGKGLAVCIADLDNDGWPDIYVANDMVRNFLFKNQGRSPGRIPASEVKLHEEALANGAALQAEGRTMASMGIACGDYDANGWLDLFISNYYNMGYRLFQNRRGLFVDNSAGADLTVPSLPYLGFGTVFFDYDNDGWLDIFVTNGHVLGALAAPPIKMRGQLYQNIDGRKFLEVTDLAGPYFFADYLGRGVAAGDFTNSGAMSLAVVHQDAPMALLRNDTKPRGHFLGLAFVGTQSNRSGLNTRVVAKCDDWQRVHEVIGGGSYLSDGDHRLLIALGERRNVENLEVRWPSGRVDHWSNLDVDRYWLMIEGQPPRVLGTQRKTSGAEP